jgi:hypothetical protein
MPVGLRGQVYVWSCGGHYSPIAFDRDTVVDFAVWNLWFENTNIPSPFHSIEKL